MEKLKNLYNCKKKKMIQKILFSHMNKPSKQKYKTAQTQIFSVTDQKWYLESADMTSEYFHCALNW